MNLLSPIFIVLLTMFLLSACVTQNYGNDKNTPIIENEASNDEIAMTRITLGLGYLKMGNTQQAKLNLEKAKHFSPNLVQVYSAFAHYYETVEEPGLAIKAYEKALGLDGEDADTLNNYGVFLCRQGQYVASEQKILKAIAIPSYLLVAQSYENLALCQLKAEQYGKAKYYLEKAIAHSPNRASSLLQMMQLLYAKNDYELAQTYLYRYEKVTRRITANALALAFKIFQKQDNKNAAKSYGDMLVKMFPHSSEAKQYILNELYYIEADKLAEAYQASLNAGDSNKQEKRVVILSPKKSIATNSANLNVNGLIPILSNSVRLTTEQKSKLDKFAFEREQLTHSKNLLGKRLNKSQVENEPSVVTRLKNTVNRISDNAIAHEVKDIRVEKSKSILATSLPIHIVKKGDNLFSISKQYNILMKSIVRWNKLRSPYVLIIGDVLYLAEPKSVSVHSEEQKLDEARE